MSLRNPTGPKSTTTKRKGRSRSPFSIARRQDGRWAFTVELPRGPDGKRRRVQRTYATYEDAQQAARTLDYAAIARAPQGAKSMTVRQLLDIWEGRQVPGEHATQANRSWLMALITKHAAGWLVTDIHAGQIQEFLQAVGRRHATRTVQKVHQMLKRSLDIAVEMSVLPHNPANATRPPTLNLQLPEEAWSQEEVRKIIAAARASRIYPFVLLALATGARIGELIGARMEDYDPATGDLTISGTAKRGGGRGKAKTAAGNRVILLPPAVQAEMAKHQIEVGRKRAQAGPFWGQRQVISEETRTRQREAARRQHQSGLPEGWHPAPPPPEPYAPLIPTDNGTPWLRGNVGRHWRLVLEKAGLPHRRLHSTRSAFITAALQDRNISLADIQLTVGHTSPLMTLRYSQRLRGQQSVVAATAARQLGLEEALGGEAES
jgi:integrase